MGPHLDARYPGKRTTVHEGEPATGLDPMAEPLFGTPLLDIRAVRVADRDTDRTPVGSSLSQQLVEPRVCLVQEDGGVHEHVDMFTSLGQQVHEHRDGDVRPLVVERGSTPQELGPRLVHTR